MIIHIQLGHPTTSAQMNAVEDEGYVLHAFDDKVAHFTSVFEINEGNFEAVEGALEKLSNIGLNIVDAYLETNAGEVM